MSEHVEYAEYVDQSYQSDQSDQSKMWLEVHPNLYHSICVKEEVTESMFIECYNCIHKIKEAMCCKSSGSISYHTDCKCYEKTITHIICKKCELIRNLLIDLNEELDNLIYNVSYDIKKYIDCKDKINRIHEISKLMREYKSMIIHKQ